MLKTDKLSTSVTPKSVSKKRQEGRTGEAKLPKIDPSGFLINSHHSCVCVALKTTKQRALGLIITTLCRWTAA